MNYKLGASFLALIKTSTYEFKIKAVGRFAQCRVPDLAV